MAYWLFILFVFSFQIVNAQAAFPGLAELLAKSEYKQIVLLSDSLLKEYPDNIELNLTFGRAFVDQGRFTEGKPLILKVIDLDTRNSWEKAWALNYLGVIAFHENDRDGSAQYFNKAVNLNATKNATSFAQKKLVLWGLSDIYQNWEKQETEHFIFNFQSNCPITDKKNFIAKRENALKSINSFFGVTLPRKITFIIWNSIGEAKERGIPNLGFAMSEVAIIHSKPDQTPGHEIAHVVSYYTVKDPQKTRFINEGIAVRFNCFPVDRIARIKKIREEENYHENISIADAWANKINCSEELYYLIAGEFVSRLLERGGKEKFLELVGSQSYSHAHELYGSLLDDIIKEIEPEINLSKD